MQTDERTTETVADGRQPAAAEPAHRYTRELTALVLAPVTIWLIGWAPVYLFDAAVGLIAVLSLHEFLSLGRKKGYEMPVILCVIVTLFIIAAFILESVSVEVGMFIALLAIPGWYVISGRDVEKALPSTAVAVLATMYVGMLAGCIIRLHSDFGPLIGPKLVYFLLLVVWLGDTGAYYTGKNLGRHKLSPRISPKKTVEGFIGGVFASVATAVIIHFTFFPQFALVHAIAVAVVLAVTGVIGDLAESMWKRSAAVKDSGTLIPGHGGFFDRFDSILYTAPILYIYWAFAQGATNLNIIRG